MNIRQINRVLCIFLAAVLLLGALPARAQSDLDGLENYRGKVISILGDSISTFAGYIPTADGHNLEHLARYPQDNLLTDVQETWWMQIITQLDARLGINDSWRGATVSGAASVTSGVSGDKASMANLQRIQNLGANGTPDVILFYGGTNDLAHVSKVGTFNPATAPTEVDLTTAKWDSLADGYVHTLLRLRHHYPDAEIIAMLPTFTKSYYTNDKLAQGNAVLASICDHYGVTCVDLRECGITTAHLPDGIHPDAAGMDLITDAVLGVLSVSSHQVPGEHVVHPVTHTLRGVTASLSYFKGISAGAAFAETLDADSEMTVTVAMGGQDITDAVYSAGTIRIPEVTGELIITATAADPLQGHLQQLPEEFGPETNLWPLLEQDPMYYTASGWGTHSSGQVYSVTIPVDPGDRLWATSFQEAGLNGSTMNGIRVTYFGEDGTVNSLTAQKVYTEFSGNGWLTVPEGTAAVNIPMWRISDSNELYLMPPEPGDGHLQQLPEHVCCETNLWPLLEQDPMYYTASGWGTHSSGQVYSVTIPVDPGDRLWATSFQEAGLNGSTMSGIRVTFFQEDGSVSSWTNKKVYDAFNQDGYLTVPEGTLAVNVPMWRISDSNELYLLNRDHCYIDGSCAACGGLRPGPVILRQPQDAAASLGEKLVISVEAQGEGLKYQWYLRNAGSDTFARSAITDSTYDVTMTKARAGREVYCVITDALGNQVVTDTVQLIRIPSEELTITKQPESAEASLGEKIVVSVEARGEGLKYRWYLRNAGSDTFTASAITDSTYDVTMTKARAGREVYCVITDALGNQVATDTVQLIRIPSEELTITKQTESAEASLGEKIVVSVEARGEGLKYRWYLKNAGSDTFTASAITDSTYDVTMTKARAGREVYCVITDALGNQVVTDTVTLTLQPTA